MMSRVPLGQIILVCVWVAHIFIFLFAIKTRQEDSQETIDLAKPREPENEV